MMHFSALKVQQKFNPLFYIPVVIFLPEKVAYLHFHSPIYLYTKTYQNCLNGFHV